MSPKDSDGTAAFRDTQFEKRPSKLTHEISVFRRRVFQAHAEWLVAGYRRFGTTYRHVFFLDCLTPEYGTNTLCRNVGNHLCRVRSEKSESLEYSLQRFQSRSLAGKSTSDTVTIKLRGRVGKDPCILTIDGRY